VKTGLTAKVGAKVATYTFSPPTTTMPARRAEREECAKQVWPPAHAFDHAVEKLKSHRI
jgi:hypothetical protein